MSFCCPNDVEYIDFDHWLDRGDKCTELNVTNYFGYTAVIQLEDNDWRLIVSGSIEGGRKVTRVDGSHDFDVRFTADGRMLLQCWGGKWASGEGNELEFLLVTLQGMSSYSRKELTNETNNGDDRDTVG